MLDEHRDSKTVRLSGGRRDRLSAVRRIIEQFWVTGATSRTVRTRAANTRTSWTVRTRKTLLTGFLNRASHVRFMPGAQRISSPERPNQEGLPSRQAL